MSHPHLGEMCRRRIKQWEVKILVGQALWPRVTAFACGLLLATLPFLAGTGEAQQKKSPKEPAQATGLVVITSTGPATCALGVEMVTHRGGQL